MLLVLRYSPGRKRTPPHTPTFVRRVLIAYLNVCQECENKWPLLMIFKTCWKFRFWELRYFSKTKTLLPQLLSSLSACSLKRCSFPKLSYLNFVHLFYLLINNYVDLFCFIMTPLSSKFIYMGKTSTVIFYFNATQTYMMRGGQNVRKTNACHCSY